MSDVIKTDRAALAQEIGGLEASVARRQDELRRLEERARRAVSSRNVSALALVLGALGFFVFGGLLAWICAFIAAAGGLGALTQYGQARVASEKLAREQLALDGERAKLGELRARLLA